MAEVHVNGKRITVGDLKAARDEWNAYRDQSGIGVSGMKRNDGKVFIGKVRIARVSYNGRVWDNNGDEVKIDW